MTVVAGMMWVVAAAMAVAAAAAALTHPSQEQHSRSLAVDVPRLTYVGQDVEMECAFPWTNPSLLYSIKWWHNNDQFYQYIPNNHKPKMMFDVSGIKVDVPGSTEFKVRLRELSLKTSGMFTCEVIYDDNFETFRKSANMTVIDPPDGNRYQQYGPVVSVSGREGPGLTEVVGPGPVEVRDGALVEAVCEARGASPPAILTWYNNNTRIPREYTRAGKSQLRHDNTYDTSSRLSLPAPHLWDGQGRLFLSCQANITDYFSVITEVELHNPALRNLPFSGYFSGAASARLSVEVGMTVMVTLLVLMMMMTPPSLSTTTRPHTHL